jgi:gamma-glutamyl phosphate reductase
MAKQKSGNAVALRAASLRACEQIPSLINTAFARLEKAAAAVHANGIENERELQLISTKGRFSAMIRHGKKIVEISEDDFSVRTLD